MSVIITGMHRAGTSAAARLVDAFGLVAGTGPMMGPAADNPRGFFERRDVSEFNDRWLRRLGGAWWAPPQTSPRTWRHIDEVAIRSAREEVDLFAMNGTAWYSKDPRTALLLPLWDRLALREHPVVVCVRHPDEVAVSLELRNGFSLRRALALWTAYTAAAVNHAGSRPSLVIDYGTLIAAPAETLAALEEFLRETGHAPRPEWSVDGARALVERELRRAVPRRWSEDLAPHRKSLVELYRDLAKRHGRPLAEIGPIVLPDWVEEALEELRELFEQERTRSEAEDARARAEEAAGRLRAERERMLAERDGALVERLAERERALAAAGDELTRLGALLAEAQDGVAAGRAELARVTAALAEAEADAQGEAERAEQFEGRLAEQQVRCHALAAEVESLRGQLGQQASAVAERDAVIARETAALSAAREEIAASSAEVARRSQDLAERERELSEEHRTREGRLRAELEVASAENAKRRTAMTEMSAELERRRAREHRAEAHAAELQRELEESRQVLGELQDRHRAELDAAAREREAAVEELDAARRGGEELGRAFEDVRERYGHAAWELDRLTRSRALRWGRVLTAPGRLARRLKLWDG